MHRYRTHTCAQLRAENVGDTIRLSGWVHRKRDHGQLVFVDLRDHYGITQCVIDTDSPVFQTVETVRPESVVIVTGRVVKRDAETINPKLPTGDIEVRVDSFEVESAADVLPLQVAGDEDAGEETRLRYRFLDLRRERIHQNILLRSRVIASIRNRMVDQGFVEFQTPILTASSPEGARDFLVPSRLHPGKFYALPQAPQQFKQLVMISGFDRYFQIAPCFRDEDSRADRSPGEFYQLDLEMSFVEQEDVFAAVEPVLAGVFREFSDWSVPDQFPRIPFAEALLKYGSDKPDLRNPLIISDVTDIFADTDFAVFRKNIEKGAVVRAIPGPNCGSRAVCDRMNSWAQSMGAPGMGYIMFAEGEGRGPIAKFLSPEKLADLKQRTGLGDGDAVFFACDKPLKAAQLAGQARTKLGQDLDLLEKNVFRLCWIVDFPMFEMDEQTGKIEFSHNPFSMPQGGKEALETMDPLDILAFQYDVVCNGVELSSGAIRNHRPDIMKKAFEIAGYSEAVVEAKFPALWNAFHYGAPPHGGIAPGIDRIVMLLADEPNIREVILFPMNQKAEDLLMGAPSEVTPEQLRELHIRPALPPEKKN
ncbi:MAG: aspartate--tRNA ligase [Oceanibaculum nanhaiense]|jgi:aspartyl-tRNA synthetase|uniref:aspartate--tRNA ligase n=2 Tax=Oceanibaculum nanhaiense TaxID=1909734 RepID=UPI0019A341B1|nr:aspartate--tRNA ligase [Oceanibaculum nanhaiense]MBC7136700.1 aspartate--tRNA ligase [Oceanibaculum nanhaiense]MDM7945315.1 aspartate--tRNA ligase [Oceanibaculum nanhaiense]